ncbi:MAG TPA: M20/M25/M40 family metallo-hydrolase [Pseudonocardiaceae bacterium]|nr:M20/M25/M40 family metallo-hydrolase [Pseudonocardiaceae bacterium]
MSSPPPSADVIRGLAWADRPSVVALIQELVRMPTRGGIDPYNTIIDYVTQWLCSRGMPARRLHDTEDGHVIALVCDIVGDGRGPHYVLDACLDTAPFGDPAAWRHPPTSGTIEDGWLHGRGAADSKAAVAIFLHLAEHLHRMSQQFPGTLTLLFDADEHTGHFGGAKRYFGNSDTACDVDGVMIGYPGIDELVIGGRGFLRAQLTVRGTAGHTGSRRASHASNAVEKAADLISILTRHREPGPTDPTLGLPPRLTVTKIVGGEGYSIVPDRCGIDIDIRLTTRFNEAAAKKLLADAAATIDNRWPVTSTTVDFHESWPAYRLPEHAPIRAALQRAAKHHLAADVAAIVAGPSNIGNYLARCGIDATAGFGVRYKALHATDECIDIATIPLVQATYHEAVLELLAGEPNEK